MGTARANGERHDDWVQSLYASVLDADPEEFGRDGLRRINERVSFGLALWETRETSGELIQRRSAHGAPMQAVLGNDALTTTSAQVAQVEVIIAAEPLRHRLVFVRDAQSPFSAAEQQTLTALSQHLVAAEALCQRALLSSARPSGAARSRDRQASPRELDVVRLLVEGKTLKQVGAELGLAVGTVSSHLYNLQAHIGRKSRSELAEWLAAQPQQSRPPPFKQWLEKELALSFRLQRPGKSSGR